MYMYNIHPLAIIENIEEIAFGSNIIIDPHVYINISKKLTIGSNTHISMFTMLVGGESLEIGELVSISSHCYIMTGTDDFKEEFFGNPTTSAKYRKIKRAPVIINRLCRIGVGSVLFPGVTLAEGVSVGANSVVTKNLSESFGIYIGNKLIGKRPKDKIMKLYEQFLKEKEK